MVAREAGGAAAAGAVCEPLPACGQLIDSPLVFVAIVRQRMLFVAKTLLGRGKLVAADIELGGFLLDPLGRCTLFLGHADLHFLPGRTLFFQLAFESRNILSVLLERGGLAVQRLALLLRLGVVLGELFGQGLQVLAQAGFDLLQQS